MTTLGRLAKRLMTSYRSILSEYFQPETTIRDFPKPNCQSLQVPRLNEEMKLQNRKAGKDPQIVHLLMENTESEKKEIILFGGDYVVL